MKKISIYHKILLPLCLSVVVMLSSCSAFDDFLEVLPTDQITGENFWEDKNDLNSMLATCYIQLASSGVVNKMFLWGEARSDNFLLTGSSSEDLRNVMNANLLPTNSQFAWSDFYTGIAYCNFCLQNGPDIVEKDASFSESDWRPIEAQVKGIRALLYFYLVRAFRDVPLITYANDTSDGANDPVPQTSSEEVLTFLINDLEEVKDNGMINFGTDDQNKMYFTRDGIYALLCDIYLWRASKNSSADSLAKYPGEAQADYQKVIDYADILIANRLADFKKEGEMDAMYYGSSRSDYRTEDELPLYVTDKSNRVEDTPFNEIFGSAWSKESIFEIAGASTTYKTYLGYSSNSQNLNVDGSFSASAPFQTTTTKPDDASTLFSNTDLRYYEDIEKTSGTTTTAVYKICKHALRSVTTNGASDITSSQTQIEYNWRDPRSYMQYRISDIMLMKAEAIACLQEYILKADDQTQLEEAFRMVNAVFSRSNPMIADADKLSFDTYSTGQAMEELVMRERQRELFADGKRWFDLVRLAMRNGNTSRMLNLLVAKYSTNASAIKVKLATMNSLFNPVYTDEIKVNTALVQNPAWITDETIVKN